MLGQSSNVTSWLRMVAPFPHLWIFWVLSNSDKTWQPHHTESSRCLNATRHYQYQPCPWPHLRRCKSGPCEMGQVPHFAPRQYSCSESVFAERWECAAGGDHIVLHGSATKVPSARSCWQSRLLRHWWGRRWAPVGLSILGATSPCSYVLEMQPFRCF